MFKFRPSMFGKTRTNSLGKGVNLFSFTYRLNSKADWVLLSWVTFTQEKATYWIKTHVTSRLGSLALVGQPIWEKDHPELKTHQKKDGVPSGFLPKTQTLLLQMRYMWFPYNPDCLRVFLKKSVSPPSKLPVALQVEELGRETLVIRRDRKEQWGGQ